MKMQNPKNTKNKLMIQTIKYVGYSLKNLFLRKVVTVYFSIEIGIKKPLIKKNVATPKIERKPGNSTGIKSSIILGKLKFFALGIFSTDEIKSLEIKNDAV